MLNKPKFQVSDADVVAEGIEHVIPEMLPTLTFCLILAASSEADSTIPLPFPGLHLVEILDAALSTAVRPDSVEVRRFETVTSTGVATSKS